MNVVRWILRSIGFSREPSEWHREPSAKRQPTSPPPNAATKAPEFTYDAWVFEGKGEFPTQIVGESHRDAEIEIALGGRKPWEVACTFEAVLLPDRNNRYDDNAVTVCRSGGGQIGYLSRNAAAKWRPVVDEFYDKFAMVIACQAIVHARPDGPKGVWLDLELKHIKQEIKRRSSVPKGSAL